MHSVDNLKLIALAKTVLSSLIVPGAPRRNTAPTALASSTLGPFLFTRRLLRLEFPPRWRALANGRPRNPVP
jgi:hypothetical protein